MSVFRTSATATRPQNADGALPETILGYAIRETAGAVARVKLFCGAVLAPSAPSAVEDTTAGLVTAGGHRFKVTLVTEDGETDPSTASSVVVAAGLRRITVTIPVAKENEGGTRRVIGRNIYKSNSAGINEVQTLTLTAGAAADTFKLTYDGVESSVAVTMPGGGFAAVPLADIQACLDGIPALVGNYTATGAAGGPFTITFGGTLVYTDVPAISVTSKTGAADGSVAETTKGVAIGTTYRKVDSGAATVPTVADNTTTSYTFNLADATIAGYVAAPSLNTSGTLLADVPLAANELRVENFPLPMSGYLPRCEFTTGAAEVLLYGR